MDIKNLDTKFIKKMAHSHLRNYVIPGLTSSLIGGDKSQGCVRLFECSRDHQEQITPHSHRFDFHCVVLAGGVTNRVWRLDQSFAVARGDHYLTSELKYKGSVGEFEKEVSSVPQRWTYEDTNYAAGDTYSMESKEVHSIYFKKGTVVLFFEGPTVSDTSIIIEPFVDGMKIPTFKKEDWMFLPTEKP